MYLAIIELTLVIASLTLREMLAAQTIMEVPVLNVMVLSAQLAQKEMF